MWCIKTRDRPSPWNELTNEMNIQQRNTATMMMMTASGWPDCSSVSEPYPAQDPCSLGLDCVKRDVWNTWNDVWVLIPSTYVE